MEYAQKMKTIGEKASKDRYKTVVKIEICLSYFRYGFQPYSVNAFYVPSRNRFSLLSGIMRYPYYDKDLPITVKFGGIGMVIGLVILHGFDNQGTDKLYVLSIIYLIYIIAVFQKNFNAIINFN